MSSSLPGVSAAQGVVKMEPIEIDDSATASTKTLPVGSLPSPDEYATDFHYTQALAKKQTRKRWALILLAALAITLVIVVPSTVFGTRRQAARKTKLSSLVSFLEDSGMAAVADADQDSPQSKAARWLASEDPANLPIPTEEHEKYRYLVRYVMTVLYYSMNGEGWARDSANFLTGDDICFWHHPSLFEGVYCTKFSIDPNRTPILLYLNSMKLSGKIPSEIGQLSLLRTVSMQANSINGAIPTELCKMSSLEALALNSNAISGTVPSCLNENAKLRELYFTYNNIRGNVPQQLCSLTNLQVVSTGFNKLSGSLPSCLGNLPRLKQLRIQQNDLSGSLPTSLCEIESLDLLSLGWNSMTGTIPTCFGGMSALQRLYLHTNEFRGKIPEELCDTKHLSVFDAGFNVLTGTIPACLGTLDLTLLSLGENSLTGSVPPELADATDLGVLLVDDNLLSGDPTSTLTKLTNLKQLYVNGNNFEGEINDSFLKNSTLLDFADFSDNKFTSPDGFPQHLIELRTLNVLDFSNNLLAGKLPDDFSPSGVLNVLSLFNNQLTGTFPRMIRRLSNLLHLDVSNNLFTGELPSDIGEMSMLEVLFLSKNNFDAGTIPSSFSGLQRLKELSLRGTNRTGALPHFISGYNSLDLLDLGSNGLTGTIPSSYSELGSLTYFLLNDNDLEGTVPATMSQLTDLRAVYLDGTTLSGDLEQLCTIPIFADNTKTTGERIIADCVDGSIAKEISCSCCLCCTAGTTGGCSEPKLNNLEIMWENSFRRQSHEIDFGGEEATVDVEPSIDIQPE